VGGFTKAPADQETVGSLCYAHSIGRCYNYNMLLLELALFVQKQDFCQLQITSKKKSDLLAGINLLASEFYN
jgi:hypothetical protein